MFLSRVRILAALIAASSVTPAMAQEETAEAVAEAQVSKIDGAVDFAKSLMNNATNALTAEDSNEAERLSSFQGVLADGLALDTIGKFMLGESRNEMSDEQTIRYEAIFPDYITRLYAEQFDEIVGKPLEVKDAREIGRKDVIVRTQFERPDESPILVDWRIRQLKSGDRKAIDIIVQGVSIMLVKREEFSAFIATNGIDELLDRLEAEAGA